VENVNDERKLELERYFDGELPELHRCRIERELASDITAARYVDQLRLLRELAVRHDPSMKVPIAAERSPVWRQSAVRRLWIVRTAAVLTAVAAGAIVGFVSWQGRNANPREMVPVKNAVVSTNGGATEHTEPLSASDNSFVQLELDARRFTWANGQAPSPAAAARAVLERGSRRQQPTAAGVEILAIELANAPQVTKQDLGRAITDRPASTRQSPARQRPIGRSSGSVPNTWREPNTGVGFTDFKYARRTVNSKGVSVVAQI
jgi:hypothetical protein